MKLRLLSRAAFFLLALAFGPVGHCQVENGMLTLFDVYDAEGGFHYSWRVDISVAKKLPQWDTEDKSTLSVAEAVRIARQSIEVSEHSDAYRLFSVCLRQPAKADSRINFSSPVFYFVTFRAVNSDDHHKPLDVAVLLSGQIVKPFVEPILKQLGPK
jgi:hypothetical protein